MAQLETGPGRGEPSLLPVVVSTVKHAGHPQTNPVLATVVANQSTGGVGFKYF